MEREYNFENEKQYKEALSAGPNEKWLKERNLGGRNVKYLPIEYQQALATKLFLHWEVIEEKFFQMNNEVGCTVKIHATPSYPDAESFVFTGSAAKPIQVNKDSKVHEFPIGKKANALEYCLPAARSVAISNALETLGNIFGRNIGRKVSNDFGFKATEKKEA